MCTRAVGALSHFLEEEGISTVGISLVRLHTEKIKPPRALWVPFELGRPLGAPGNPDFQKRVILSALQMIEAQGPPPLLKDFAEDAPFSDADFATLACPVSFPRDEAEAGGVEQLLDIFRREISSMRPWYDIAVEKRGRTTVGSSGMSIEAIGDFIYSLIGAAQPNNPCPDLPLVSVIKLAGDDLKAYYFEAITAQPGQEYPSSRALNKWFWSETAAGEVMFKIKETHENSEERTMRMAARGLLVPREVAGARKK